MFNAEKPSLDELPSSKQLFRSTVIALIGAIVILIAVILPAEYGIDPTGAGRVLGLTEMGEIKRELSEEAAKDHSANAGGYSERSFVSGLFGMFIKTAHAQQGGEWADKVQFTLDPGDTYEVKLTMNEGDVAEYQMSVEGGRVNFDLHAHGNGQSITYEKGRGSRGSDGAITAAFTGDHGWFWRNRDGSALTVTLQVRGTYSALKQGQ